MQNNKEYEEAINDFLQPRLNNLQDKTTVCLPPHLMSWISSFLNVESKR